MSKENAIVEDGDTVVDDAGLEEALSAAVDEVTYEDEPADDEPKDDEPADDEPKDDEPKDDEPADDDEPKDDEPEGDDEPKDDESADDEPKDDESADDEPKDDEPEGDPDHVNDPIPEGTNKRTAQRIQSLISDVKELDGARQERDDILEAINRSGASPDQYAGALTVISLFNSESLTDKEKCLEIIDSMRQTLSLDLGKAEDYVKLEDYPDLRDEVVAGTLSEDRAYEIAANRASQAHRKTRESETKETRDTQQQTAKLVDQGKADLNAVGQELMADPAYRVLYPQYTAILQATLNKVHPTEWATVAKDTYARLKAANPKAGAAVEDPKPKPKQQPLRPKGGSSASKASEADSALAAMDGAIEGL